jgi:hypothetical protein
MPALRQERHVCHVCRTPGPWMYTGPVLWWLFSEWWPAGPADDYYCSESGLLPESGKRWASSIGNVEAHMTSCGNIWACDPMGLPGLP